jgi:hypothetical protein
MRSALGKSDWGPHARDHHHPEIRIIKDMAADRVLLASAGALINDFLLLIAMLWP